MRRCSEPTASKAEVALASEIANMDHAGDRKFDSYGRFYFFLKSNCVPSCNQARKEVPLILVEREERVEAIGQGQCHPSGS